MFNFIPVFVLFILLVLFFQIRQVSLLATEVNLLPERMEKSFHPLTGKDFIKYVPFLKEPDTYMVVQMASPTCSICSSTIEQFLLFNEKRNLPYFIFTFKENNENHDSEEKYKNFHEKFNKVVPIFNAPRELISLLDINQYPLFFVINKDGIVTHVSPLVGSIKNYINNVLND